MYSHYIYLIIISSPQFIAFCTQLHIDCHNSASARVAVQNERQPRTSAQVREDEVEELELEWAARARHAAAGATAVSATHPRFLPGTEPGGGGTGTGSGGGTEPGGNCNGTGGGAIGSLCTDSGTGIGAAADCATRGASVRHAGTGGDTAGSERPSKRARLPTEERSRRLEPKYEQSAAELNGGDLSGGRRSDRASDSGSQLSLKHGIIQ